MSNHSIDSRKALINSEQIEKLNEYFAHKPLPRPTYRTIDVGIISQGLILLYMILLTGSTLMLTSFQAFNDAVSGLTGAQDNSTAVPEGIGLGLLLALFIPAVFTLPFLNPNKKQTSNMPKAILPATSPFYASTLEEVEQQQYTIKQLENLGNPTEFPQLEKEIAAAEKKIKKAQETFDQSLKPTAAQQDAIELAIEHLRQ